MLDEKIHQLLTKELEQARTSRSFILSNRQLLFNILIAAWSVLVTLLVFSMNKWGFGRSFVYYGIFSILCLGSMVNIITILRFIVSVGELDITRIRINLLMEILSQKGYFPEYLKVINFDFGELYTNSGVGHYSSFTTRFDLLIRVFISSNSFVIFIAIYSFLIGTAKVLNVVMAFFIPVYSYLLLLVSALCFSMAWFVWMNEYFVKVKKQHNEDASVRIDKYCHLISPLFKSCDE